MRIREKMYELFIEYNSHYAVICDSCFSDTPEEHESKIYGLIDHLIANGVTIEAEPLRHGRWESDEADVLFHCSACETQISTSWDYDCDEMWNYCPHCGAKMDGDNHGNVEM